MSRPASLQPVSLLTVRGPVTVVMDLRWGGAGGGCPVYAAGPSPITWVLNNRERTRETRAGDASHLAPLALRLREGLGPHSVGSFWKLDRQGDRFSPEPVEGSAAPPAPRLCWWSDWGSVGKMLNMDC